MMEERRFLILIFIMIKNFGELLKLIEFFYQGIALGLKKGFWRQKIGNIKDLCMKTPEKHLRNIAEDDWK